MSVLRTSRRNSRQTREGTRLEGVEPLSNITRVKAREKHKEYLELMKTNPSDQARIMKRAYYALSQGNQVIDLYEAFQFAGKHEDDKPKLGIARAHLKKVVFAKRRNGAGAFFTRGAWEWFGDSWGANGNAQVALPPGTWTPWEDKHWKTKNRWGTMSSFNAVETLVPTVPAKHHPAAKLERYFILWEVEAGGWSHLPIPPGDPMLLQRISPNLFVVHATWDLTRLEKAVLKGAILQEEM